MANVVPSYLISNIDGMLRGDDSGEDLYNLNRARSIK